MQILIDFLFRKNGTPKPIYTFIELTVVRQMVTLLLGGFFPIFIYRTTGSFELMLLGIIVYYISLFPGNIIASFLLPRIGYFKTIRFSFFLLAVTHLLMVIYYDQITQLIFPFLFARSMSLGIYFVSSNLYLLQEQKSKERLPLFFLISGFTDILGTILPILAGFMIVESGYRGVIALVVLVYTIGFLTPSNGKISRPDSFNFGQLFSMLRLKGMPIYLVWQIIYALVAEVRAISFTLAPFLVLGRSEFNVGIFVGIMSFSAGTVGIIARNWKRNTLLAYVSAVLLIPIYLYVGIVWNPIAMFAKSILTPVLAIFFNSKTSELNFDNMQNLLGKQAFLSGIELQVVREFTLMIGRVLGLLIMLAIVNLGYSFETLARVIIAGMAIWPLLEIIAMKYLSKYLRKRN